MPDVDTVIEAKVKAFAKDITKFLNTKRDAKVAALKKAGDPKAEDKVVTVNFKYSSGKGSLSRTPQQQATYVSNGTSWTCAGSHMIDKARHVLMFYGAPGKKPKASWAVKEAFGSKDHHFVSLSDLQTKWKALMKSHGLKNHKGGDGWGEGDAFHFELPDSKVPRSDKRVQACLQHYAKITRLDGKPRNDKFEKGSWKTDLKPHLASAEKEAEKAAAAARAAELKKLRFEGSLSGKQTLLRGANRSQSVLGKSFGDLDAPKLDDRGKPKSKRVSGGGQKQWDMLPRAVLEAIGVLESKGFDVKLTCGLAFNALRYEPLTQGFLLGLTPTCSVIYNTPAAKFLSISVAAEAKINLSKSAKAPKGEVIFRYNLTGPTLNETGQIVLQLDGEKVSSRVK